MLRPFDQYLLNKNQLTAALSQGARSAQRTSAFI